MTKQEIEGLKYSLRIEEVVGRYIQLQRVGRLWRGLCPFHGDRHPSLTVDPEKQTFVCYACGEKGDVFSFIRKIENCSFGEAVEKLSATHPLPPLSSPLERGQGVCNLIKEQEVCNPEEFLPLLIPCASGHSDLSGTWLDFEVGQSPCQVPSEWRTMRNRIIFPIRDEAGRLAGFAARRLSDTTEAEKEPPKYINSSASDLYRKSELLYGLYRAKDAIRREEHVFVVEGYKDVLAMHAAGFTNTVALCGTALCPGHIALLKKYTNQVYLLLDGDQAGIAAAGRASALLLGEGMEVSVCRLPAGEDPDSLFRQQGKTAFRSLMEGIREEVAPTPEGVLLRRIRRGIDLLSAVSDAEKRGPLLSLLGSCIDSLVKMSHQAGRPASMDWRWV